MDKLDINIAFFDKTYEDTKAYLKEIGEWESCRLGKMLDILTIMLYINRVNENIDICLANDVEKIVLKQKEKKEPEKNMDPMRNIKDIFCEATYFDEAYKDVKHNLQESGKWKTTDYYERFFDIVLDVMAQKVMYTIAKNNGLEMEEL